jgi:hypothetical protein
MKSACGKSGSLLTIAQKWRPAEILRQQRTIASASLRVVSTTSIATRAAIAAQQKGRRGGGRITSRFVEIRDFSG